MWVGEQICQIHPVHTETAWGRDSVDCGNRTETYAGEDWE